MNIIGDASNVIIQTGVNVQALAGSIFIEAGDNVEMRFSSNVFAANDISIYSGYNDVDGTATNIAIDGTVTATGAINVTGSANPDTFEISGAP